jgi:hypothetical protein
MFRKLGEWTSVALLLLVCGAAVQAWAQGAPFAATLGPIAGGSGTCRVDLRFDDLGAQLTYDIVCDGLPGTVTSAYLAGPLASDAFYTVEPRPDEPLRGKLTLNDGQAGLLTTGKLFIGVTSAGNGSVGGWAAPR